MNKLNTVEAIAKIKVSEGIVINIQTLSGGEAELVVSREQALAL